MKYYAPRMGNTGKQLGHYYPTLEHNTEIKYYPYEDSTWDIVKYSPLPLGAPSGTPSGKGLYLTVCPLSPPNTI